MRSVVVALVVVAGFAIAEPTAAATHTVTIDGLEYQPATITVKAGEPVVWINKDPFPHTVTAAGAFDSGEIGANRSWRYVPRKKGDYPYVCTFHPNMKGTLRVE